MNIAVSLTISPEYLRVPLKFLTVQGTQQHVQYKRVDIAEDKLSNTNMYIIIIAYDWALSTYNDLINFSTRKTTYHR
ncbi:hypothetical protein [uncultured Mucilaginibacter sp.]|uniref:hypothetical protein n=1 Tax=uncultured Mucilaginibacter sp. TaxID=797541 RepID=UPI0025E841BB|nr:hypothetical protein [uncultured Mucilaginibacter sp.]